MYNDNGHFKVKAALLNLFANRHWCRRAGRVCRVAVAGEGNPGSPQRQQIPPPPESCERGPGNSTPAAGSQAPPSSGKSPLVPGLVPLSVVKGGGGEGRGGGKWGGEEREGREEREGERGEAREERRGRERRGKERGDEGERKER